LAQAADPGAGFPVAVIVGTGAALPDEVPPAGPVAAEPVPPVLPAAPVPADGVPEVLAAPHPAASAAINIAAAESATRALACVMVIASFLRTPYRRCGGGEPLRREPACFVTFRGREP
jgi:hypothetical protein